MPPKVYHLYIHWFNPWLCKGFVLAAHPMSLKTISDPCTPILQMTLESGAFCLVRLRVTFVTGSEGMAKCFLLLWRSWSMYPDFPSHIPSIIRNLESYLAAFFRTTTKSVFADRTQTYQCLRRRWPEISDLWYARTPLSWCNTYVTKPSLQYSVDCITDYDNHVCPIALQQKYHFPMTSAIVRNPSAPCVWYFHSQPDGLPTLGMCIRLSQ